MSLNGLDTPPVQEAYTLAVAEAGGWFLLKYTSRDSVELLGRGKSGVHEARLAIAKYEESSPLYGLIIYRRRKVLIKYIPEGTSRLLQARTAVHFQDVTERYSPYETLLEITTSEGLNDTALAASFPLHTASPSASSSRLHEISEDGEDHGAAPRRTALQSFRSTGSIFGTQRYKTEKRVEQLMSGEGSRRPTPSIHVTNEHSSPLSPLSTPLTSPLASPQKTSISQFLVREESGQRSITSLGSQPSMGSMNEYAASDVSAKSAESATTVNDQPEVLVEEASATPVRSSLQGSPDKPDEKPISPAELSEPTERPVDLPSTAERPSISDSVNRKYDEEPYNFDHLFKPKVKLAPRPVAAGDRTKRPTVASISTVPSPFRPIQKKPEASRSNLQGLVSMPMGAQQVSAAPPVLPRPPPIPDMPEYLPRPVSRGSVKSLPSHRSTVMTPDKIRLMKAVELRKRQLRKSNPQQATFTPPTEEPMPAVPKLPRAQIVGPPAVPHRNPSRQNDAEARADEEQQAPAKKADSGIELSYDGSEKREEKPAEEPRKEEHVEPPVHSETLAQLEHKGSPSERSLKLDTSRPPSAQPVVEEMAEPTMSLDMLQSAPNPTLSNLRDDTSSESPILGRAIGGLGISTPQQTETKEVPAIIMTGHSREISNASGKGPERRSAELTETDEPSATDESMSIGGTPRPPPEDGRRNHSDLAKRRRGIVEPLHIESSGEGELVSDDEFMEELQGATVQEATPMTMARSPLKPSFERRPSGMSAHSDQSALSVNSGNVRRSNLLDSTDTLDASIAHVSTPPYDRSDPMQGLKRPVSNGISRRIQALAETSREPSPNTTPRTISPETSPQLTWRERTSMRSQPRSRTSSWKSVSRHSDRASGYLSPPLVTQQADTQPTWSVQHDPASNRDSVSVSARIVRSNAGSETQESAPADAGFQQPRLTVNHRRASASQPSPNKLLPPLNTNTFTSKSESAPIMASPAASLTPTGGSTEYRSLHSSHQQRSFGRYKQTMSPITPSAEDFPPPPIQKSHSRASIASSHDENAAPREGTRTSRFFKRMSNLGGKDKRRSGAPQLNAASLADLATIRSPQRNGSTQQSEDRPDMPPSVVVGNLNVQFPDTLLWKRRIAEISDDGYLVFSIPQAMDIQKNTAKRFHLSEFRQPYAPDLDRQELPHSVMLDFVDGAQTTLQAACEDAMTHRQVLYVLRSYWKSWAGQT